MVRQSVLHSHLTDPPKYRNEESTVSKQNHADPANISSKSSEPVTVPFQQPSPVKIRQTTEQDIVELPVNDSDSHCDQPQPESKPDAKEQSPILRRSR